MDDIDKLVGDLCALRENCDVMQNAAGAEVCRSAATTLLRLRDERDEAREALTSVYMIAAVASVGQSVPQRVWDDVERIVVLSAPFARDLGETP